MESYIEKFKKYVLEHLGRRSKKYRLLINQMFLGFYIGKTDEGENGVGYITGQGLEIKQHVVTMMNEGERVFLEAIKNEDQGYEYEWSYGVKNAAAYDTEEKAIQVITALGLDAEVLYVGDVDDFHKWKLAYPEEIKRSEKVEFKDLSYDTIKEVLNLKLDIFGLADSVPPMILKSLLLLSEQNNIKPELIRVYVVPTADGKDVSVHVFNDKQYVTESSLSEMIFSAMVPS